MNKQRRNALQQVYNDMEALLPRIEELRDEEQEYFDNMPESLQGGEKGSAAEQAIESITNSCDSLQEALDYLDESLSV